MFHLQYGEKRKGRNFSFSHHVISDSVYDGSALYSTLRRDHEKRHNVDYDTYGFEGERDYAIDNNGEYQPSDYDEMYEVDNHMSTRGTRRPEV